MMKKAYTAPLMDTVRIAPAGICAGSAVSVKTYEESENVIDETTKDNFWLNSSAFEGGLFDGE